MVLSLTVTTDQALTAECFERLASQMIAKGWQVGNASVFTRTIGVQDSLLIPPTALVTELQAWATEMAVEVTHALSSLPDIPADTANCQPVLPSSAAPPEFAVLAVALKQRGGQAGNDEQFEDQQVAPLGSGQVIDMEECLTWMGETIQMHLDGAQKGSPTGEDA